MKIGIYANIGSGDVGGVQQYIEKLSKALVTESHEEIHIITNRKFYDEYFINLKKYNNFYSYLCENDEFEIKKIIYSINLDVIHFPFQCFPYYYWNIPTVITLHDLQQEYFPEFFSEQELNYRLVNYKKSAEMCDQIIVSFKHVKDDIIKFYKIPENKVSIAIPGIKSRNELIEKNKLDIHNKYNIHDKYILYPAQTWKHKNHLRLLEAIKLLRSKYDKNIHLICTGRKNDFYIEIERYIFENGLQQSVTFLDYIPLEDLNYLYLNSELVVIPTLYEAGSFPLFEAMTLNVPVICSNVTSLPETIGNKKFIFNPYDAKQMANLIENMLENELLRKENIKNSKIQISKYEWKDRINDFLDAYKIAIRNFRIYNQYKKLYKKKIKYEHDYIYSLNKIRKTVDSLPDNKKIIIYGAGEHTKHLIQQTNISRKDILCIVDRYSKDNRLLKYDIREVEYIEKANPDIIIISSFSYQNEIEQFLINELLYNGILVKMYDNCDKAPFYI